jgi:hypothetical protein
VEAALADWNAAVSSKSTPAAAAAGAAEASSSSCCNYNPHAMQQQQQGLPGWQQLYQQRCPLQYCCRGGPFPPATAAAAGPATKLGQVPPAALCRQAQHTPQQLVGLLQQAQQLQQQPWCLRIQLLLQQQTQQQLWHQAQQQQQVSCPFAAFSGDVVGAVLSGQLPAPSADSNDDWMGPMGPLELPACF